jgi:transposase InsO family protein
MKKFVSMAEVQPTSYFCDLTELRRNTHLTDLPLNLNQFELEFSRKLKEGAEMKKSGGVAADESHPGVGDGLSSSTVWRWADGAHPQCGRYLHVRVPDAGADTSLGGDRVTRVLERLIAQRGRPENVRSDNGPEFTSRQMLALSEDWKVGLVHIQSGRPMQNGRVESFHGRLRDECLNASWFRTLNDVRCTLANWREEYNCERPTSRCPRNSSEERGTLPAFLRRPQPPTQQRLQL